jgi:hypothetical protein
MDFFAQELCYAEKVEVDYTIRLRAVENEMKGKKLRKPTSVRKDDRHIDSTASESDIFAEFASSREQLALSSRRIHLLRCLLSGSMTLVDFAITLWKDLSLLQCNDPLAVSNPGSEGRVSVNNLQTSFASCRIDTVNSEKSTFSRIIPEPASSERLALKQYDSDPVARCDVHVPKKRKSLGKLIVVDSMYEPTTFFATLPEAPLISHFYLIHNYILQYYTYNSYGIVECIEFGIRLSL